MSDREMYAIRYGYWEIEPNHEQLPVLRREFGTLENAAEALLDQSEKLRNEKDGRLSDRCRSWMYFIFGQLRHVSGMPSFVELFLMDAMRRKSELERKRRNRMSAPAFGAFNGIRTNSMDIRNSMDINNIIDESDVKPDTNGFVKRRTKDGRFFIMEFEDGKLRHGKEVENQIIKEKSKGFATAITASNSSLANEMIQKKKQELEENFPYSEHAVAETRKDSMYLESWFNGFAEGIGVRIGFGMTTEEDAEAQFHRYDEEFSFNSFNEKSDKMSELRESMDAGIERSGEMMHLKKAMERGN